MSDEQTLKRARGENGEAVPVGQETRLKVTKLLEPLSREQLFAILADCGSKYPDVLSEISRVAGADPAHRKIFVRGLAWETTTESLLTVFTPFGEVEEGTVVMDRNTGKSRGFGFVTFKDMSAAQLALEQPTKLIDGRSVQCNLAAVRGSGPSAGVASMGVKPPGVGGGQLGGGGGGYGDNTLRKLFVRGLSWDTTDQSLHQAFAQYGDIEEAAVAQDRMTGKSKGYGFVTYVTPDGASRALEQPQKQIDGRSVTANLAAQGKAQAAAAGGGQFGQMGGMGMGGMGGFGGMGMMGGMNPAAMAAGYGGRVWDAGHGGAAGGAAGAAAFGMQTAPQGGAAPQQW